MSSQQYNSHEKSIKTELSRQSEPLETQVPEQYVLMSKLSEGGMGSIYKAQNRFTGKFFAIKVLLPEYAEDNEFRQRFISEARAASALQHPHICQVYDFGVGADKSLYLVMDWIDGVSLQKKIEADGPLSIDKALLLYQQIAAALAEAHKHKIIHRDIKPDNIMLRRSNSATGSAMQAYLVDFGLAKAIGADLENQGLTTVGMVVGTPMFMSPEQARAMELDVRSDIYSLGCVMYFALTACPPFRGDTAMDTMFKHINEAPPEIDAKLKIPADLKNIVLKSMEKEPNNRYQDVNLLLEDLSKIGRGVSIGKITLSSEEQKSRQQKMSILLFVVGFLLMYFASNFLQGVLDRAFPEKEKHTKASSSKK